MNDVHAGLPPVNHPAAAKVRIPPCPAILTRLLREVRAEEPDFRRVGQLIGADVALAAEVIKSVNLPAHGRMAKAASVQQAVSALGLAALSSHMTGLLLAQSFPSGAGKGMAMYWKSSMTTAHIAAQVARETGLGDPEVCHTYTLFENCGMPVMMQAFPIYADILEGSALTPGERILEIEGERYATNHAVIGAALAREWQLDELLCLAIEQHHTLPMDPVLRASAPEGTRTLVATGLAAAQIYALATRPLGGICHDWKEGEAWVLDEFLLTPREFEAMSADVLSAINQHRN